MKIIDCFIFYNELELLKYRFDILQDIVDYFVIVESKQTFMGKPKKLYFNENISQFSSIKKKIIHIIIDNFPFDERNIEVEKQHQWLNEYYQRNTINSGILSLELKNEDIILISDVDEIPDPKLLHVIKFQNFPIDINSLEQDMYYYNLNTLQNLKWCYAKILSFKKYKELNLMPNDIRLMNIIPIKQGGWHLSYFGNANMIQNKIMNFSHQEYNNSLFTDIDNIQTKIESGIDLFNRKHNTFSFISTVMNTYLPPNYEKFFTLV
jgi:beta-1,4-mannosyl-glycoprotein beta-1,4-N-acetylglucosaminyltransferase